MRFAFRPATVGIIGLCFGLAWPLFGCGGKMQAATPPSTQEKLQAKPQVDTLEEQIQWWCKAFFYTVNDALQIHLTRTSSERPTLLAEGYRTTLKRALKDYSQKPEVQSAIESLLRDAPETIADCAPYRSLATALEPDPTDRLLVLIAVFQVALDATLKAMDPYSGYLRRDSEINRGVGIHFKMRTDYELGRKPNYLVIEKVWDDSPNIDLLEKAEGDRHLKLESCIHEVDGKAISELGYAEANETLNFSSDKKKTEIVVSIEDAPCGENTRRNLPLKLGPYTPGVARFNWADEPAGIGRLQLTTFRSKKTIENFLREWVSMLYDLLKPQHERLKGLIVDLRGNGGGLEEQAQAFLELFLPRGSVMFHRQQVVKRGEPANGTFGSKPTFLEAIKTTKEGRLPGTETVLVLVDRATASASELVASALWEYGRALVVGEKTFGKGIGQTEEPVPLGGSMLVVNHFLFSPSGFSHQALGITPHIEIPDPFNQRQQKPGEPYRMSELLDSKQKGAHIIQTPEKLKVGTVAPVTGALAVSQIWIEDLKGKIPNIPEPPSCQVPKDSDDIKEEDDCLLDWSKELMKKLIELKGKI